MSYYKYGIPDEDMIISEWHDPSYTIRAFNTYILDVDITELDIQYHTYWQNTNSGWQNSSEYYFGGSVPSVGTVFIGNQENWVYPNVPQSTLNTYTQLIDKHQGEDCFIHHSNSLHTITQSSHDSVAV